MATPSHPEPRRHITGEARAAIGRALARRYHSGESRRALASSVGRSLTWVDAVLTEQGVSLRRRTGSNDYAAFTAETVRLHQAAGLSIRQISAVTGRDVHAVALALRQAGIQVAPTALGRRRKPRPPAVSLIVLANDVPAVDVSRWGPREILLLRLALRMSVRDLANHLGTDTRTISKWEAGAAPRPFNQRFLDDALRMAKPDQRARFAHLARTPGAEDAGRGWVINIPVAHPDRWHVAQVAGELVAGLAETYPAVGAAIVNRPGEVHPVD